LKTYESVSHTDIIYKPYLFAAHLSKALGASIPNEYDPIKAQQKIEQLKLLTDKDLAAMSDFGLTVEDLIKDQEYQNE